MWLTFLCLLGIVDATGDSIRLFDDLMLDYDNRLRPGTNRAEPTTVHFRLSLSQVIEMDEINQVMMCSVWLRQTWMDERLAWDPEQYGRVSMLHVPYEIVWVPDIVLYNAESTNNITISTKVTVHYNGQVIWEPPAVFRSTCQMDVKWFPFDEQHCSLKFGSWSFNDNLVNLQFIDNHGFWNGSSVNETASDDGIDLSDYYPSVEWEIMSARAVRNSKNYRGCCPDDGKFVDLTFELTLRRKPLFYTVNLIMPNVFMALLTPFVFYLPCESGEKIQLAISILVSVAFYFLLLTEIIPASGTTLPLIGKYLLFTMLMVSLSCALTVIVLNVYYRTPSTHSMSSIGRTVLLKWLPSLMRLDRDRLPTKKSTVGELLSKTTTVERRRRGTMTSLSKQLCRDLAKAPHDERLHSLYYSRPILKCLENVGFISQLIRKKRCDHEIEEDWKYAAAVLDRFFLFGFQILSLAGTIWVFAQTPFFYDHRQPVDLSQAIRTLDDLVKAKRGP